MGVTGLWQILAPCARPTKLETLHRRRLAVDASIWIYQFLKAVRDKEGNALRNSHVVGFYRRICKLLFHGIRPVFVFDGGAPSLKRSTISARKARREGRREDAVRTAGKLLAVQMQRLAEEEDGKRRRERERRDGVEEEEVVMESEGGQKAVYAEEIMMSEKERRAQRNFKKTDAYHLPDLDTSLSEMSGGSDPRIMSLEELEGYARQFESGEDINVYDFSKIDYDGPFFMSLPASDRYNILNAARLRSRLRMGHSKEQLDSMFPDRMAFSKFQIERVTERNELTQRLMHLNGFENGMDFGSGRVAGEKGREYVLVKNDGVEGGWALGVISDEGKKEKPIDVDKPVPVMKDEGDEEDDEDGFEDVPIEGLNRLPKQKKPDAADALAKRRQGVYKSRRQAATRRPRRKAVQDPNSLFVQEDEDEEVDWEEVDGDDNIDDDNSAEDEDLRKAIAMSLEKSGVDGDRSATEAEDDDNDMLEVFHQSAVEEQKPLPKGSGRAIANIVNKRAFNAAPESREITSFGVPTTKPDDSDEEDSMDFQAALAESRRTKRKTSPPRPTVPAPSAPAPGKKVDETREIAKKAGFSGPLPFESLDLGSSLLGKRKMQQRTEEASGGFENPETAQKQQKKTEPLPPWFAGDIEKDIRAQKAIEDEDREKTREFNKKFQFQDRGAGLRHRETDEVIDLEADDDDDNKPGHRNGEIIDLDAEDERTKPKEMIIAPPIDATVRMGDIADELRADPPAPEKVDEVESAAPTQMRDADRPQPTPEDDPPTQNVDDSQQTDEDEQLHWSESERGSDRGEKTSPQAERRQSRSPSADFEDVAIPDAPVEKHVKFTPSPEPDASEPVPASGAAAAQESAVPDYDEFDDFSDPEEAEMLRALTIEAEEHARFASSLNNKTQAQNIQEYERELKKLRTQQKKDRRDADEVTQIMITECQQLLRLFGLPYITAPMEAEAQCAELVHLGLVDGIVTDDSDCFLFGGTRIYKNMFNQAKFVECYLSSDLEKEFDLDRPKLISIAQLLGSDYTEGIPGVGPVTALEIISEFPTLGDFADWWGTVQTGDRASKAEDDAKKGFRKKFRRNATKLFLPPGFPDRRVTDAYLSPEVDADPEPFQWGAPDLQALRAFLSTTVGWTPERTDEVLVPVIRDMNRRLDEGTQSNLTAYFEGGVGVGGSGGKGEGREGFAPRKKAAPSKRMGSALDRMAERAARKRKMGDEVEGDGRGEGEREEEEVVVAAAGKRKGKGLGKGKGNGTKRQRRKTKVIDGDDSDDDDDDIND